MDYRFNDGRDWFFEKRFGLFLHWGVYAFDGWHEQMQYRNSMPKSEYRKLMDRFNPVKFNPDEWLDFAEAAGMEYLCFTTKHIDGFCMWDTKQTDFKITNTPYKKDVLETLIEACHRRGFPLNLYYSTIDNDHPAYPHRGGPYEKANPETGETANLDLYLEFIHAQIEELCTRYGEISGIWWDCNGVERLGVRDESFNTRIRELQPNAVINNRGFSPGDFDTPERDWRHDATESDGSFTTPVEACQSVGIESWGYRIDEDYYEPRHIEASMSRILARGGNYLLNVGPRGDGTLPPKASAITDPIGKWLRQTGDWFRNTTYITGRFEPDHMLVHRDFEVTQRDNTLFVILTGSPLGNRVLLKPIEIPPTRAVLLNTNEPVQYSVERIPSEWRDQSAYLRIHNLRLGDLAGTVPIIRLEFDRAPFRDAG